MNFKTLLMIVILFLVLGQCFGCKRTLSPEEQARVDFAAQDCAKRGYPSTRVLLNVAGGITSITCIY